VIGGLRQGGFALGKAFVASSVKNPQTIGLDLVNAPRVSGNLWTRYNVPGGPFKGLGFGTGLIYSGKSWGGDPSSTVYFPVSSWARVDSAIFYKWHRYELALNLQNPLDRKYIQAAQTATILIPGDAAFASLREHMQERFGLAPAGTGGTAVQFEIRAGSVTPGRATDSDTTHATSDAEKARRN